MKPDTFLIQGGRKPEQYHGMVNMPVYRTSTVVFSSIADYHAAERGKTPYEKEDAFPGQLYDTSYGITGTPTTHALARTLAELEGGDFTLLVPSGLSAITTTLLALVQAGDHVLVTDSVYGPTRRFCTKMLTKLGVEVTFYNPLIGDGIAALCKPNTKLIFTESPGSITFEVQDIPAIAKVAKAKNILVITDNSWAGPLHFKPFEHGVDVSVQAVTKYIGGHSDVMMGSITARKELFPALYGCYRNIGVTTSPDDCYLIARGLRTMGVRLRAQFAAALELAGWLEKQPKVKRVIYPPLPSHPQHALWKRYYTGGAALFSIILDKHYDEAALARMIDPMEHFAIGCSWGGYESLILNLDPGTARSATKWQAEGSCVRVHIGLEDAEDLRNDLAEALARL